VARDLERQVHADAAAASDGAAPAPGLLLAFAYPDRIGRRRAFGEGRYALTSGRGAHFASAQGLARQELIVAVDLDDAERDARILLAAPLARAELYQHFVGELVRADSVEWNSREQAVSARRTVMLDELLLEEQPLPQIPAQPARAAMLIGVRELGIAALPWERETRELQARVAFVRATLAAESQAAWPDLSDEALAAHPETWLAPWLEGVTRREQLARIALGAALRAQLTSPQQRELEEWAPTHLTLPGGTRARVDYLDASAPLVAVRLQEVFGLAATPRLGRERVAVTFKLLSPAQRPLQVTRDLASFWRGAYAEVRKDMRGRYPKHYWPEDPLQAQPTRGRRPRT
jgi:ATP-dependent helicase HrpB